jgi:hypothetical protein
MVVATLVKEIIAHRCQSFLYVANIAMFFQTAKRKRRKYSLLFLYIRKQTGWQLQRTASFT